MATQPQPAFLLLADKSQFNAARFFPYMGSLPNPKRGEMYIDGYISKVYNSYHSKLSLWQSSLELPPPKECV